MKYLNEPFPHEDGAPASLQDKLDFKASSEAARRSQEQANEYLRMILSTMK